jgi:hypothetical protein
MRRMARNTPVTVAALAVCLAAGIAAGVATGTGGATKPGLPPNEQSGGGAFLVGCGVALLVGMLMRIAYVLYKWRSQPEKTYSTGARARSRQGLTAPEYLGILAVYSLLPVLLCCMGLVERLWSG